MTAATASGGLSDPDALYQSLIDLHEGLTTSESHQANARLILLLIALVDDQASILKAVHYAAMIHKA